MWIFRAGRGAATRHGARTVRSFASFFTTCHCPLAALLFQNVDRSHASAGRAAFGGNGNRGFGAFAVKLHGRYFNIHAGHIQAFACKVIEHTLTHRVFALVAAIAGGEGQQHYEKGSNSHNSIITGLRVATAGELPWFALNLSAAQRGDRGSSRK